MISIRSKESGERLRTLPIEATAAAFSDHGRWFYIARCRVMQRIKDKVNTEGKDHSPKVGPLVFSN